jgi:hypothetical protein
MKHKVKIALAIDKEGNWSCAGWGNINNGPPDNSEEAMDIAVDSLRSGERRYFVEAEIELPVEEVIQGKVIDA